MCTIQKKYPQTSPYISSSHLSPDVHFSTQSDALVTTGSVLYRNKLN